MCCVLIPQREKKSYSLHKDPIGCTSHPLPTESDFWPTMLSREQRGYQNSDSGGNHYYVGYLCQARVLIPEYLISDHLRAFYSVTIQARCILQTIRSTILFIRPLLVIVPYSSLDTIPWHLF